MPKKRFTDEQMAFAPRQTEAGTAVGEICRKMEKKAAKPIEVPLPDDLPDLYRAYVDDLVSTLNDEGIVSRASDLLHDMIERVVVRHDSDERLFDLLLEGNIVGLLTASNPAGGGAYARMESPLKLVAGGRNSRFPRLVESVVPRVAA